MKIVFLSSYFNHHQSALSDALWRETGGDFVFVETDTMPREQRELGYPVLEREYLLPWRGNENRVLPLLQQADVVIAGAAPQWLVRKRIRTGKLLLRYSERPLRHGAEPMKYVPRLLRWHWWNPPGRPIYLLAAGAYTAGDYAKFGLFRGRSFCWGYFPERKPYDVQALMAGKHPAEILWCGRFLELKHPEEALRALKRLRKSPARLTFVGGGPGEAELRERAEAWGLGDKVRFAGAMPPAQVRREMERAGIFLFTSGRQEGWGVVVNEAMNSGCAVIASHAAGSVPYLIQNGENGLVYPSGDVEALAEALRFLLEAPEEQKRLGTAAYETIRDVWNGDAAAKRLIRLSRSLLDGETGNGMFADGPCSPAKKLDEGWFG